VRRAVLWSVAFAVGSLWLVAPAPSYDPWAWLLWGRELAHGSLTTSEGPAFKPLPTFVALLLAPLGGLGPEAWVALARSGAVLAVVLAQRLGRELGGSRVAGGLAALGLVTTTGFLANAGEGLSEGLLLGLALAAWSLARSGRPRAAVGPAVGCALLRVETWPFLLAWAALDCVRSRRLRPVVVVLAVLVLAAWFVPEWAGSGQLLRSASRARVPNPGQPALARFPAWASLREAVALPPWPAWAGLTLLAALAIRPARTAWRSRCGGTVPVATVAPTAAAGTSGRGAAAGPARSVVSRSIGAIGDQQASPPIDGCWLEALLMPAGVGLAWMVLVALMAQLGFSGEARYAMPGAGAVAASGGVGLAVAGRWIGQRRPLAGVRTGPGRAGRDGEGHGELAARRAPGRVLRPALVVGGLAVTIATASDRLGDLGPIRDAQAYQRELQTSLPEAIAAAGGRDAVVACGTPFVGPGRGPVFAYALRLPKPEVEPDDRPHPPGMVFRSALHQGGRPAPDAPPSFQPLVAVGPWEVLAACDP
jgi:hypothetical protein